MDNDRILLFSPKSPFVLLPSIVFDLSRIPGATRYSIARLVTAFAHIYALSNVSERGKVSLSYRELQKVLSLESKAKVHSILAFLKERKVLGGKLLDGFFTSVTFRPCPYCQEFCPKCYRPQAWRTCFSLIQFLPLSYPQTFMQKLFIFTCCFSGNQVVFLRNFPSKKRKIP